MVVPSVTGCYNMWLISSATHRQRTESIRNFSYLFIVRQKSNFIVLRGSCFCSVFVAMSSTHTITQTDASAHQLPSNALQANIELQHVAPATLRDQRRKLDDRRSSGIEPSAFLPQPSTTVSVAERWSHPKANTFRTLAVLFAFTIMGANDAAYGVSNTTLSHTWTLLTLRRLSFLTLRNTTI